MMAGTAMLDLEQLSAHARVTVRRAGPPAPGGRCVVYWMQRAQRASDNPALDVAVRAANLLQVPVVVFLGVVPGYPGANRRHYRFLAEGLPDLARGLEDRRVGFVLRRYPDHELARFCAEVGPALVVGDENPLRETERWRAVVAERVPVPVWTVDADVIVPSRLLEKEQYAARTMRPRIRPLVPAFLADSDEPRAQVPWAPPDTLGRLEPVPASLDPLPVDESAGVVPTFRGGAREGLRALDRFVRERLDGYAARRNHPDLDATSRLSPYLHFGQLGPRMVARAVRDADAPAVDRDAFLEEFIVRRELAVNFVRFNPRYETIAGCEPWAIRTLDAHRRDERRPRYVREQLESAVTHDPLWNAAQIQMVESGWMHGYLRMYWAKKILEWTRSPEDAFAIALLLNDRYELDGHDPNGFAGIAWAIGGKHDRAWGPERPVYGTVRYMSFASTSRKFDSKAYIRRVEDETGRKVIGFDTSNRQRPS
jgi:deoxyribodipyrimidine photo-lyase